MEKLITVFTPTYNREKLLEMCYESLRRQTSDNFLWLIVDDGSTDNTKLLVNEWMKCDNNFEIQYIYKENGGLHTGYNTAIEHMTTELSVCIDSDDYMPDNAIEIIEKCWEENKHKDIAGIVGLDFDVKGNVIGSYFSEEKEFDVTEFLYNKLDGDKKYVIRNDLYKQVAPMPTYKNEKNFNPHYMALKIAKTHKFRLINQPLCIVDYQPDGMSANILNQFVNSPYSFAEYRRAIMQLNQIPKIYRFRTAMHYVSSSILSRNIKFVKESPNKLYTVMAIPFGVLLTLYIKHKTK